MPEPELVAPTIPFKIPPKDRLKQFSIGLTWAVITALLPVGRIVWDDIEHNEFTDWHMIRVLFEATVITAGLGFWQRHKAWLMAPPGTELVTTTKMKVETDQRDGSVVSDKPDGPNGEGQTTAQ